MATFAQYTVLFSSVVLKDYYCTITYCSQCSFSLELLMVMICFKTTFQKVQRAEVSWECLGCPFGVLKVTVACNYGRRASEGELDGRGYRYKLGFQQKLMPLNEGWAILCLITIQFHSGNWANGTKLWS